MIPLFSTFNPSNLKRVFAALGAALAAEHKADGTHGDVTADSVAVAGALSAGGDADVGGSLQVGGGSGLVPFPPTTATEVLDVGGRAYFPGGSTSLPQIALGDVLTGIGQEPSAGSGDVAGLSLWGGGADPCAKVGPDEILPCRLNAHDLGNGTWYWRNIYGASYYEASYAAGVGKWTAVAYDAANFTASAGTWTVDAGDQLAYAYTLVGKTMTLVFSIDNTDVSSIAVLRLAIPGGFTSARTTINPIITQDAGTFGVGIAYVGAGGTNVFFYPSAAFNSFSVTSGDNTSVWGEITFEVQ